MSGMVALPLILALWAHLAMPEMGTPPPQRLLHRWYSPSAGRFLSRDPIGFEGGQINLYQYVGNNPVNHRDPTGLFLQHALSGGMSIAALQSVAYYTGLTLATAAISLMVVDLIATPPVWLAKDPRPLPVTPVEVSELDALLGAIEALIAKLVRDGTITLDEAADLENEAEEKIRRAREKYRCPESRGN